MNYRYDNDAMKNYLVIECDGQEQEGENAEEHGKMQTEGTVPTDYQYRMLSANNIPGLLPCKVRKINSRTLLYYDITSLRSLQRLYSNREIQGAAQKKILYSLTDTEESIAKFLLDSRRILLQPELIFYSYEKDSYYFVYSPRQEEGSGRALFEFLAAAVDASDKQAAAVIYQLIEAAENPNFILTSRWLDQLYEPYRGDGRRESEAAVTYEEDAGNSRGRYQATGAAEPSDPPMPSPQYDPQVRAGEKGAHAWRQTASRQGEEKETDGEDGGFRSRSLWIMLLAVLFLGGAAAAEFIHIRMVLPARYDLAARGGAAVGVGAAVLLAGYGLFLSFHGRVNQRDTRVTEEVPEMEPTLDFRKSQLSAGIRRSPAVERPAAQEPGAAPQEWQCDLQNKLYGEEEARPYRIDLRHLPCTVGSQNGSCDISLPDTSIAATHVRFQWGNNGQVLMTDLNSQSGTYLNGVRLSAGEAAEILPGDEVRLGRFVFCYR